MVVSLETELEKLADAAIADWPEIAFSGQFVASIRDLYRSQLLFPPSWPQERRDEFVMSNADMDAIRLTTKFDDIIDTVTDRFARQHGALLHNDHAAELVDAERRAAIYELEFDLSALSDEIAEIPTHSLGRAGASMIGCSPVSRRSQASIKPPRHRIRKKH